MEGGTMAGKRKAEGIALLSVYGGDDDDAASQEASETEEDVDGIPEGPDESFPSTLQEGKDTDSAAAAALVSRAPSGGLGIVDYAHEDEGLALSPEAEDGEILSSGTALGDDNEPQADNGFARESPSGMGTSSPRNVRTPQPDILPEGLALLSPETANVEDNSTEEAEGLNALESDSMELDILNDFLPPAPTTKYSEELQNKFSNYLALKKTGKSYNEQLRNSKGYRNPDFLQRAVWYFDIDHIGSCFKKEIFDPHGYDQGDYYDSIALEVRRDAERKEQERRQSQRVDFVRSTIQGAVAVAKPILPIVQKVSSSDASVKTEGRTSKKSKWDKVELDRGRSSQSISSVVDTLAVANVHTALLTASASAGTGYASFAQQRRREVEVKLKATEKYSLSSSSKVEGKTDR